MGGIIETRDRNAALVAENKANPRYCETLYHPPGEAPRLVWANRGRVCLSCERAGRTPPAREKPERPNLIGYAKVPGLDGILKRKKISRNEMAARLGVNAYTLRGWALGRARCPLGQRLRLARLLGVSEDELLKGAD